MNEASRGEEQGFVISGRRFWVPASSAGLGAAPLIQTAAAEPVPARTSPVQWVAHNIQWKNRVGRNLRACLVHPPEGRINSTCILRDWSFSSLFMELPGSAGELPRGSFTHVARKFLQNLKPASLLLSTETTHTRPRERFILFFFSPHLKIFLLPLHLL